MPYRFTFSGNDGTTSTCSLVCHQCIARKPDDSQCRNRVCIGLEMCWVHTRVHLRLMVRDAGDGRGKGVFAFGRPADVLFREGQLVCRYNGERINRTTLNSRYGDNTAPYTVQISRNVFEDGACKRGVGSVINHASGSAANARFVYNTTTKVQLVLAKRDIRGGEEILVDYGDEYELSDGSTHKTRPARK